MNIITSQISQSQSEIENMVCKIHKCEIIAIDLESSEKSQLQYLCCNCLVEKMNNNKISTIEQTKDRIKSLKTQRQESKIKEIQIRLDYFKKILDQIMEFKCNLENSLEKIYSQIKAQIFVIQKEKQSFLENSSIQNNFQEDVKQLSQFLSIETQENNLQILQDNSFIDEIFKQFDLLFNNAVYFQTIDTFKAAKQKIQEINENIKIQLNTLRNKNNQVKIILFLNRICPTHNKEIIMIDIDSKNKKIEDRFVCVDCIKQLKKQMINGIIQNFNSSLNEINLSPEELIQNINYLIQQEKENLIQDSNIEYMKSKDQLFQKEMENRLEHLKQHNQLDIQESINILQDLQNENLMKGIFLLSQQIQEGTKLNQEQLIFKQELDDLINYSKQIYCQMSLFNQTIHTYQEHLTKIKAFNNRMKQFPDHVNLTNLQKQFNEYVNKFENDFKNFKKFNEIEIFENNLETLQQDYKKLQLEKNQLVDSLENDYKIGIQNNNKIIDELKLVVKDIESKLKEKQENEQQLNIKLKEEKNSNDLYQIKIDELYIQNQYQIQELNQKLGEQEKIMKNYQIELEKFKSIYPIINLKPKLASDDFWLTLFFQIQSKCIKTIKCTNLIYLGTRDGLNSNSFWDKVNGKINLLMLFKSKSEFIFGGYTPCKQIKNDGGQWITDDTLTSFIFSQTKNQIYHLKPDRKQYAMWHQTTYGPVFGTQNGNDIQITKDFQAGSSSLGLNYDCSQFKIENTKTHLFGQSTPNIVECEIYEIQFF
ncbi:unnamed protein product [Paramecium pentaurelia]|uniref:TLDc domain-containing protein n=1 Tax=Paramecium pentaurelia TaxID=43138 RepID=A0A8S1YJP5_9CILI|nr:unnamed protein product [Paramecium pentaurelia]